MSAGATVVVVHGLWMHSAAMLPLAWRLQRSGFKVARFSYRSVRAGLEENAARLVRFCAELDAEAPCLVGHSLGGLTILAALGQSPRLRARRIVLLGVPYGGIEAAHGLARFRLGQTLLGRSIRDALDRPSPPLPAGLEVGVIAGDVPAGMGRIVARLPKPNDGVVCVKEARVPGARDTRVLHVNHAGMLLSAAVAHATCAFLKEGRFGPR
jgi:pimeloyl-ACP methyl ester carboxylesterase